MSDQVVFESAVDQAGFTQIPNVILRDGSISPQAKTLYALLRSYAWQSDGCFTGQVTLGEHMGVTDRSIRSYVQELEQQGVIRTERRGSTSNRYVLLSLEVWYANRKPPSGPAVDRKDSSGLTGSVLPQKKTQEKKTPLMCVDERARGDENPDAQGSLDVAVEVRPRVVVNRKVVGAAEWRMVEALLARFNTAFKTSFKTTNKDVVTRIVMRLRESPEVSMNRHCEIIAAVAAGERWWGEGPPDTVGVVYGPRAFSRALNGAIKPAAPAEENLSPAEWSRRYNERQALRSAG